MLEPVEIVASSNIKEVAYDLDELTLFVTFHNGSTYKYVGVKGDAVAGLRQALSSGQYFNQNIKNSYPYEKVL